METLQSADGQLFIRNIASFIRKHEVALANSLQVSKSRRPTPLHNASSTSLSGAASPATSGHMPRKDDSVASVLSRGRLLFTRSSKRAQLTLTPHHLYYLLSRMEDLDIEIGPMTVRLENIHTDPSPSNYVSFLQARPPTRQRRDSESLHSVSSVRSVMSSMSALWSNFGLGSSASKSDKAKAAVEADLKYLYAAFTKIPSIRFGPDHQARLIAGYEEFPFDTAVPLFAFKNLQELEIVDMDFRRFHGWDRLAENVIFLTLKRAKVDDPTDLITNIVLDDAEKRRRRSNQGARGSPTPSWTVPSTPQPDYPRSNSDSESPVNASPQQSELREAPDPDQTPRSSQTLVGSVSPKRPTTSRPASSYRHVRSYSSRMKRSGSGGSMSGDYASKPHRSNSSSSLLSMHVLPPTKWLRLKYLCLADNALTSISAKSLSPLANSLRSLNLAANLFTEIPEGLVVLTSLNSLDLSNCMIESLKNPLPAISTLRLRSNRLRTLAGIEHLKSLECLDVEGNRLADPAEAARLTDMPNFRRLWVKKNPLADAFPHYRVTIFNLFRQTPGHLEDIVIDGDAPSSAERRLLVERAPEKERPVMARSITIAEPPALVYYPAEVEVPSPDSSARDDSISITNHSTRRKKGPRRRIVDLSQDEPAVEHLELATPAPSYVPDAGVKETPVLPPSYDRRPDRRPLPDLDVRDTSNAPGHTDLYRQKIEALKQQFGNNWISVLSEQGRLGEGEERFGSQTSPPPSMLHLPTTHAIVSGGRTIG